MGIPTIYCGKKQALPNEDITVIASIRSGEWQFHNTDISNIVIQSGTLYSNVLTFKCITPIDPLIIGFLAIVDEILNGQQWIDNIVPGIGDYWQTPIDQDNSILSGWNFEGRSQRITQTTSEEVPYIYQPNLTVSGESYTVEIDYRSISDIDLKVGGQVYTLSATEEAPFNIYPIVHEAGAIKMFQIGGTNPQWIFTDGTFSTSSSISKILPKGTSYLIVDNFSGITVSSTTTGSKYIGNLSDIPNAISHIELLDTNVVGELSEISHISDIVAITNANITGNINTLSGVSSVIDLEGCDSVIGDIGVLNAITSVSLNSCNVFGVTPSGTSCKNWYLDDTSLSVNEISGCLINLDASGLEQGHFQCYTNMPTVSGDGPCDAILSLGFKDWTIIVNSYCPGSGP